MKLRKMTSGTYKGSYLLWWVPNWMVNVERKDELPGGSGNLALILKPGGFYPRLVRLPDSIGVEFVYAMETPYTLTETDRLALEYGRSALALGAKIKELEVARLKCNSLESEKTKLEEETTKKLQVLFKVGVK